MISSSAIVAANSEVEKSICPKSQKGLKKRVCSPREHGKTCVHHRNNGSSKKLSRKLGVTINESTVRGCKKAYIAERSAKRLREEEAKDVSITLAPWPSTMASQDGLLNSAYFFVWGGFARLGLTIDA